MPFDKLRAFNVQIVEEKTLRNNFPLSDFEWFCVKDSSPTDGKTTTWVGEREPISVSVTSNLFQEPIFICDNEPHSLLSTFLTTLKNLAEKSKNDTSLKIHDTGANKEKT